ncbi:MAG TPA: GNAT family N-acetyltransferase [Terriglobales bacterium]|nr:GNAT family N-acetyltransferase [Terriglobales bacterium]
MQFVDRALARRLESAEEMPQVHHARVYEKSHPETGAAVEEVGGGHAMFAGLGSPIGHAAGIGLDRPFTPEDLDRVEAFYRRHGAPSQVDLTPLHEPAIFEMFKQRGYAIAELNNVLWRQLEPLDREQSYSAGVSFRRGRAEESRQFAAILARCFQEYMNPAEGFELMLAPLYEMPGVMTFVASDANQVIAVAAGLVIPEHKVLALFGAGTLPEHRRRGIQAAMLDLRLRAGAEAGCEIAVVVTQGGTVSQRNCERLGFRVAYSKATLVKPFPQI